MVTAYPMLFAIGVLAGFLWMGWSSAGEDAALQYGGSLLSTSECVDAGLVALTTGLVGARAGFVILHWGYYQGRLAEIVRFWEGGLTWVGGVLGALLGLALFAWLRKIHFWSLADALIVPGTILASACWTGCLVEGCAFGQPVGAGFALAPPQRDMFGVEAARWPTQAIGAVYSLLLILAHHLWRFRPVRAGMRSSLGLVLLAAGGLGLSFIRADAAGALFGIRIDALGSGGVLVMGLAGMLYRAFSD